MRPAEPPVDVRCAVGEWLILPTLLNEVSPNRHENFRRHGGADSQWHARGGFRLFPDSYWKPKTLTDQLELFDLDSIPQPT